MDVARPYAALCPTLDSDVLNVLAGTNRPLTGREVARLIGRKSHSGVLDVLSRLSEHGLVDRQEAGKAYLYTLNREHLAAPAVVVLAGIRTELLARLRHAIADWDLPPVHVSLFGSVARGEGDATSDIDLFVVRPDDIAESDTRWRGQIDELSAQVARWTGNHAGIAEAANAETKRLRKDRPPIVAELGTDAIVLSGNSLQSLLGTGR
jgi:DNA-binding transcriptional ArsR family regulator